MAKKRNYETNKNASTEQDNINEIFEDDRQKKIYF